MKQIALRFMLVLAFAMLSLSLSFFALLSHSVTKKQDTELFLAVERIHEAVREENVDELAFLDLPYYITYTVYEAESKKILSTNDSLLPLLDSGDEIRTFFQKNFFTDSDLNIRYLTKKIEAGGKTLILEGAIDIANDSAVKMIANLPRIVLFALVPLLLVSFALSLLISRSSIAAFKKLQEDYDRARAFTSNVSHELKTPISIIDGHANLLKRWGKDDPKQLEQSVEAILHETENMNQVVTTLLEISRIENGKIKIENSKFFVTNFFAGLKNEFKITHPDVKFEIVDEDFLEIETDEQKLHQIFTVILSNSVKFSGENCTVTLKAHKSAGKTELSASDNGKGFSEEELPHIFERFYKGDSSHDRNVAGAGLGLSIAKTLCTALGAKISAENSANGGATVKVLLP